MERESRLVSVKLPNGGTVRVEATPLGGEQEVAAFEFPNLDGVVHAIEGIAQSFTKTLDTLKPDKGIIKFGIEVAVSEGNLTGIFVKGSGKGNLEVTLEWTGRR